jgi:hypothetical protein
MAGDEPGLVEFGAGRRAAGAAQKGGERAAAVRAPRREKGGIEERRRAVPLFLPGQQVMEQGNGRERARAQMQPGVIGGAKGP